MKRLILLGVVLVVGICSGRAWSVIQRDNPGVSMFEAAKAFLDSLDEKQRAQALLPADAKEQVEWHFIPKDSRKGLQIKEMTPEQRRAALGLLRASLSESGYEKATRIMDLEVLLHELEKGRDGGPIRDPERYYYTLFGEPAAEGRWALSIEGHHLSLNFVVADSKIVASTPTFFAANPAIVKNSVTDRVATGTRVLAAEEELAFTLVRSLDGEQRKIAIIADAAPREIRAAGEPQPPQDPAVGIRYGQLNEDQKRLMRELVMAYCSNVPPGVSQARIDGIVASGPADHVHFAWAGADKPGVGHYYRIQGPTFLIEFVNTQPDAAGNPANHIHCVYRDMHGDFGKPIE